MTDHIISPRQARAARAYLGWDQRQVATAASISEPSVRRFELGQNDLKDATRTKLATAFQSAGVEVATIDGTDALIFRVAQR